jgi:hypothetical protein
MRRLAYEHVTNLRGNHLALIACFISYEKWVESLEVSVEDLLMSQFTEWINLPRNSGICVSSSMTERIILGLAKQQSCAFDSYRIRKKVLEHCCCRCGLCQRFQISVF